LNWLQQFFDELVIFSDYAYDWEYFCYLVRDALSLAVPERMSWFNIAAQRKASDIEFVWTIHGRNDHHALFDARVNQFAFDLFNKQTTKIVGDVL
jgi:hypothetical protein